MTATEEASVPQVAPEVVATVDAPDPLADEALRPIPDVTDTGPPRYPVPLFLAIRCLRL